MLLENGFTFFMEFVRKDCYPLLSLIIGGHIKVKALSVGHFQQFSCLLTSRGCYVEEQEWHLFAKMSQDFEDVLHEDVDGDDLTRVDDAGHLDEDPLLSDGDLLLGQHLVVTNPDRPAGEGTPVTLL